jgi:hypothetical protein
VPEIGTAIADSANSATEYSGIVLSSVAQIRNLCDSANRIARANTMLAPEFFLASLSKGWEPRVVAVWGPCDLIGVFYAKERVIKGIRTGIVYADGSLGGVLLADPHHHQYAFRVAVETLLASSGIRGIRLRVLRSGEDYDAVLQFRSSDSLDVQYLRMQDHSSHLWKNHAYLALADTYDRFLQDLGSTTRHNFRYYRRRFETSGHRFVEQLSVDELRSAMLNLRHKSKFTACSPQSYFDRNISMISAACRPLAVGLKHRNGEWLSVLGGWYMPHCAVLYFQSNNEEDFAHDSLSIVLRAYLIEMLIRQGLKELVIWAGTAPPLSRYVSYAPTIDVRLDVAGRLWRVTRSIISTIGPYLPKRLAAAMQWVS